MRFIPAAIVIGLSILSHPAWAQSPIMYSNGHSYRIISVRDYYYPPGVTLGSYNNSGAIERMPQYNSRPSPFPSPIRLLNMSNPSPNDPSSPMNYYPPLRMYYWQVQ